MKTWNPRFVAYARSQGRDPEAQLAHDEETYPGGIMCGFMLFISEKWRTFSDLRPDLVPGSRGLNRLAWLSTCHADQFDAWLQESCNGQPFAPGGASSNAHQGQ